MLDDCGYGVCALHDVSVSTGQVAVRLQLD